jgi:hypothetical protein
VGKSFVLSEVLERLLYFVVFLRDCERGFDFAVLDGSSVYHGACRQAVSAEQRYARK